ncbi:Crossover junction endonuclease MUS81 [Schistosoma japonicum]|nr:Crossover junction endonuclease MUS81 [Schistosoma japonicum]
MQNHIYFLNKLKPLRLINMRNTSNLFHSRKKKKSDSGPNLLFQSWITEAMENAFAKDAKSYYAYRKALSSLKKYPLLLQSGKDCKILEGFGVKLCDLLDEKLNNYAKDLQLPVLEALHYGNKSLKASKTLLTITKSCQINQLSTDPHSSYALHFTYVDENNNPVHHKQNAHQREYTLDGTVTKSSITSDFTFKPMPKVNSINLETGIKRCKSQESVSSDGSINKSSRVCANFLMPETTIPLGYPTQSQPILARQLSLGCTPHIPSLTHDPANYNPPTFGEPLISQSISCSDPINVQLQTSTQIPLIVPGNSYEIILLADVRENFGSNKVRQMLPTVFQKYHIKCESRALPVGDFLWIARWRNESDCLMEAVLNQIVERKRMDDLAHSIVDGRFMEQKYRLKRTGLLQLMYLIEECPMMHNQKVSYDVLIQAISNSQMIDGLQIMTTKGPEDTVDLLAALSQRLQSRASNDLYVNHKSTDISCKPNTVNALSWCEFVKLANKSPDPTPTVTKLFLYFSLMEAYDKQLTALDKDNMLADLKPADSNRCLGTAFSRRISLAFNTFASMPTNGRLEENSKIVWCIECNVPDKLPFTEIYSSRCYHCLFIIHLYHVFIVTYFVNDSKFIADDSTNLPVEYRSHNDSQAKVNLSCIIIFMWQPLNIFDIFIVSCCSALYFIELNIAECGMALVRTVQQLREIPYKKESKY